MDKPLCEKASIESALSKSDLERLLDVAKKASELGGQVLMKHYGNLEKVTNKGRKGDLVTNADIEAEQVVLRYLNENTPEISVLAEETGSIGQETSFRWCVDPLDGTTNFAHGYPFFATSIGLTWKQIPLLGSISIPFLNETYFAAPEIGAFCNSNQIKVSKTANLEDSLLVTGFAYDRHTRMDNNYAEFAWLTNLTRGVRRGGAAAVDLAFVASGKLDGYWERGLSPWDLAAGVAIVELSGGYVGNYPGGDFDIKTGRILACNPFLKQPLKHELKLVKPLESSAFRAIPIDEIGS
ncbi:inositol monophosphatase family protein [Prochlorococcus sp. MIT 1300]|uniref:inositol monophosphatase family protein n=1 Tax=Prochlorococcus sp. MIT 1300 TaxID=3096218 RepID=UPI002A750607|nr:inositol monophosphatase family protein [Prochlorococcus sp. MIT 1300]